MEKAKYNIRENMKYVFRYTAMWDKHIIGYFILYICVFVSLPVCGVLFPKFVLEGLTTHKSAEYFIGVLLAFACVLVTLTAGKEYIEAVYDPKITYIRFQFLSLYYKKCMCMKYEYTESPEMLDKIEESCAAVGSSGKGLAVFIKMIMDILIGAISIIIYGCMLVSLKKWVLLILFFNAAIMYLLQYHAYGFACRNEDKRCNLNRRVSYLRTAMCESAYGKDIRLFDMGDWLCNIQKKI